MNKFVNFANDIDGDERVIQILAGAYEKCNIHPAFSDEEQMLDVLKNETDEAHREAMEMVDVAFGFDFRPRAEGTEAMLATIEAQAWRTIMETLQVLSVIRKWERCRARNDKEV